VTQPWKQHVQLCCVFVYIVVFEFNVGHGMMEDSEINLCNQFANLNCLLVWYWN